MKLKTVNLVPPQRIVYGIADALAIVPIGRTLLYEEIRAGRLRAFRIGKRRLIDAADLRSWVDAYKMHGETHG